MVQSWKQRTFWALNNTRMCARGSARRQWEIRDNPTRASSIAMRADREIAERWLWWSQSRVE